MLEVGAGAGNTAFPVMRGNENEDLVLWACDFSRKAVEVMKGSPLYEELNCGKMEARVWDVAGEELPEGLEAGSVDVVLLVFVFSALSPRQWNAARRNVWRLLRPGGEVCFRDYGRGDLAQVRFKKGRWMEENFYARGDGTRVYFFEEEELRCFWGGRRNGTRRKESIDEIEPATVEKARTNLSGAEKELGEKRLATEEQEQVLHDRPSFEIASLGVDRRLLVNRQRKLKMYRCWMQGRFRKPNN